MGLPNSEKKERLMTDLTPEMLVSMYRRMLEIRHFEKSAYDLSSEGALPGLVHVSIGQEAVSVGVCSALRPEDTVVGSHRSHGHSLAKGASADSLMAELMGRRDGCCKGYGGSMHVTDVAHGMLACTAIVGGGFGIAGGAAFSHKLRHTENVSVCFFGDGALGQGAFFETLNMASKWALPLVLVCENNLYGMSTPYEQAQELSSCSELATPYHIWGAKVDGNDILTVYDAACTAIERARRGDGPSILDCITYRWTGHGVGDPAIYRTAEELELWKTRDPIKRLREYLVEKSWLDEIGALRIDEEAQALVADAVRFAEASPHAIGEQAWEYLYSESMLEVYRRCES
jgi:TPP-dependent pyruvate/acetoin dehydrogenase alpha subunit